MTAVSIHPIRAFSDNYIWIFENSGKSACVVDPGDAQPVFNYLEQHDLTLSHILVTHHHADHTGGIEKLKERFDLIVYGPARSPCQQITNRLAEADKISVLGYEFEVLEVPGHTLDHIAYYCAADPGDGQPLVFCGDTLFSAGCGRIFEGSPPMMYDSLTKLAGLPTQTRVYCTHEYTLSNLRFAAAADPGNKQLAERTHAAISMRERDEPTLPSTIELELATNPFLRCDKHELVDAVSAHDEVRPEDPASVFAALRKWKDQF